MGAPVSGPVQVSVEAGGGIARLRLSRPKGNVLDAAMVAAIREHLKQIARPELRLIVFEGEGDHFSFGASVPEHLPDQVEGMLRGFHQMFRDLEALCVPTAAVVRGQCLGGGFELALACGRVICSETARFANPEVKLGVFPPIAAALLPHRIGMAKATELIVTGRTLTGAEAVAWGVAEACVADPDAALLGWYDTNLAPLSAVAVRYAWRATRRPIWRALNEDVPILERLYLDQLMMCSDPIEGLEAFLARRPPNWRHA